MSLSLVVRQVFAVSYFLHRVRMFRTVREPFRTIDVIPFCRMKMIYYLCMWKTFDVK